MNSVARIDDHAMAPVADQGASLMAVISRAASDPSCDIDKMERLMQMHERMEARQAEAAFASDLAMMQTELPAIGERGQAKVNGQVRYTFALWEDMNAAIKPVLSRFGFALSFRMDFASGIEVTGVLSHKGGHNERTSIKLPADSSGSKNDVQAVASSVSYGKRYTAGALLNLTSHGEDDDAFRAVTPTISEEQIATLNEWIDTTASDRAAFCKAMRIESIEAMPADKYKSALAALKKKADTQAVAK